MGLHRCEPCPSTTVLGGAVTVGTFLEYVAERLMGPPAFRSGGRSTWPCPFHSPDDHPSFCTLPPKNGCKDRYRCFSCGVWGDEFDLVKNFFDRENFGERRKRLAQWREDFKRDVPAGEASFQSPPGTGSGQSRQPAVPKDDPRNVESAFADMIELVNEPEPPCGLWLLVKAADICITHHISLDALASVAAVRAVPADEGAGRGDTRGVRRRGRARAEARGASREKRECETVSTPAHPPATPRPGDGTK